MIILWSAPAVQNLDDIFDYILSENPSAAITIYDQIKAQVEYLVEQPAMGRPGRVEGTRELIISGLPYIVVYRVRQEIVEILAVLHGARRWPDSFDYH